MERCARSPLLRSTRREQACQNDTSREIPVAGDDTRSQPESIDPRRIDGIIVEPETGFPAVHAGDDHPLEQRWWRIPLLVVLPEHDLRDLVRRIEPDEIEQRERS